MSHSAWLFMSLIISMVVILFLILKVKLNAAISLVLGSILMGALSGVSLVETIDGINVGFGNMLKGMGLPIGFGIILGELVSRSGGAQIIASKIVKAFFRQALWVIRVVEGIFPALEQGHVSVHPRAIDAEDGLGHKGGVEAIFLG